MAGIVAFCGLQGSGKSYSAIELGLVPALEQGRVIVSNMPLLLDVIKLDFPKSDVRFIDLTDATCLDEPVFGAVYLLDELWKIWQNGQKMSQIPVNHLKFLKEHRHMSNEKGVSIDIFLLTQTLSDFPDAIRNTIERTVICEKISDLGMMNSFKRVHYRGAVKGFAGSASLVINMEPSAKYKAEVFRYYKTHMYGQSSEVVEDRLNSVSIFSGPRAKFIAFAVLTLFAVTGYSGYSFLHSKAMNPKPHQVSVAVKPSVSDRVRQALPPVSASRVVSKPDTKPVNLSPVQQAKLLPLSKEWRISGVIHVSKTDTKPKIDAVLMVNSSGFVRRFDFYDCLSDKFDLICLVDEARVTEYSGSFDLNAPKISIASKG